MPVKWYFPLLNGWWIITGNFSALFIHIFHNVRVCKTQQIKWRYLRLRTHFFFSPSTWYGSNWILHRKSVQLCKGSINYVAWSLWDISLSKFVLFLSFDTEILIKQSLKTHILNHEKYFQIKKWGCTYETSLFRPKQNPIIRSCERENLLMMQQN